MVGALFLLPEICTVSSFHPQAASVKLIPESEVGIMSYQNINPYAGYQPYGQLHQEVIKVNGRAGAEMYQLAPNSSMLLLDESAPIVWLKQTDGAGYPTLTPYTITPYEPEKPVDVKSLEERIVRLEEALNVKSDSVSLECRSSNDTKSEKN